MTKKIVKRMLNCGSNLRIILLKFSAANEISKLKESRKNLYSFHIYNKSGISDEAARSLTFRDTQEQADRVMSILKKISNEKKKSKGFNPK